MTRVIPVRYGTFLTHSGSAGTALDQLAAEQHVDRTPGPPGDLVVQDLYPVTLGLYTWNNEYGQAPQLVSYVIIGSLISVIPLVVAFLCLQRFWKSGLAAGSVQL